MFQRARESSKRWNSRLFCSVIRCHRHLEDEGDWFYSSEWWGTDSGSDHGHTVLRSTSSKGNGVVSVVAYPSSRPDAVQWTGMEKWLRQRYGKIQAEDKHNAHFRILGYQWRVLRFNDITRQSTVKIMAAYRNSDPTSVFFMQQPDILAVPYLKSMVSVGLTTIASCNYDLMGAIYGGKPMHILCIGHGGGSLPLFLASKIPGAIVHSIEIDPLVISASVQAMGFPAFSMVEPSGERVLPHPEMIDEVLWKGTHERLFLYESDAEKFILNSTTLYDLVFIDAYDGEDIFPRKLWDPQSPFLEALKRCLHPQHGTVVVNLHSDADFLGQDGNAPSSAVGKYVSRVCQAYKEVLGWSGSGFHVEDSGLGFVVSVPWLCNSSLVVCRGGFGLVDGVKQTRDLVLEKLVSKSCEVEGMLKLPFSCLEYIKRAFVMVY
ncbi:hypothetical protein BVC80_8879g27 [Macleaya cordata]|uniref:S-adenosyl-L-methionine-dependent methyltransferase n=1 Tax=Macleaya cordata TaxID=56857 RepID=A0A200QKB1_MACCD|nr:hypothetical protein BVC80_8879g27 [Macleaya cordata]